MYISKAEKMRRIANKVIRPSASVDEILAAFEEASKQGKRQIIATWIDKPVRNCLRNEGFYVSRIIYYNWLISTELPNFFICVLNMFSDFINEVLLGK